MQGMVVDFRTFRVSALAALAVHGGLTEVPTSSHILNQGICEL